jgi:hypothetical protein
MPAVLATAAVARNLRRLNLAFGPFTDIFLSYLFLACGDRSRSNSRRLLLPRAGLVPLVTADLANRTSPHPLVLHFTDQSPVSMMLSLHLGEATAETAD